MGFDFGAEQTAHTRLQAAHKVLQFGAEKEEGGRARDLEGWLLNPPPPSHNLRAVESPLCSMLLHTPASKGFRETLQCSCMGGACIAAVIMHMLACSGSWWRSQ